jgi:hypothetical protein
MGWVDAAGCGIVALAASLAMLQARRAEPLGADEAYLWYGVQQSLQGRWPHRDFKSYEPGRYLWSASFGRAFGAGLLPLRCATHLFFTLGLGAALLALRWHGLDWPSVLLAAVALSAIAHPQHKLFEHGCMLLAWAACARLLLVPSALAWACEGLVLGLSLAFGFNLFLYAAAALAIALAVAAATAMVPLASWRPDALALGILLGALPMLAMALSPGFARMFHQRRIATVIARGESNLSLPRPWPWRVAPAQLSGLDPAHRRAFQWIFLLLLCLPLAAIALSAWRALPPALDARAILAAATLGLALFHHAASRADPSHILQSSTPACLLLLLCAAPFAPPGFIPIAGLALWLVWPLQHRQSRRARPHDFSRRSIGGCDIDVPEAQARLLDAVAKECGAGFPRNALFAAPVYPALYAALGLESPVYDTFCLDPASDAAQAGMIEGIERAPVRVGIVSDAPIDGREELRFSRTHPRVWAHLHAHFDCTRRDDIEADVFVFVRQAGARS